MTGVRTFLLGLATAVGLGVGSAWTAFAQLQQSLTQMRGELPKVDPPGTWRPPLKTRILAADGTVLAEIYRENRELVPLEQLPRALIDATIASEDRRFYRHPGVSPRGVARALVANTRRGRISEGASTITMQLARDVYLSREQTWRRKLREALLATEIEKLYSKDEILELYLNQINYGKGAFGVRTAARMYFGKDPARLTLSECAALAAAPRRPTDYHLYRPATEVTARRDQILGAMYELGLVTAAERDAAVAEPLEVVAYQPPDWKPRRAPYYTSWAIREVTELLGEEAVYHGGLTVTTAVDLALQETADRAVANMVGGAAGRGATDGAAVLIDPLTGGILAIAGGRDWAVSQFNHATQARRQPGSAFKLFVYAAALDRGYQPDDTVRDAPFVWRVAGGQDWRPRNYDGVYRGEVSLKTALALSINTVAARLTERVGVRSVVASAQRLGIGSPLRPVPSIALGTSEVTLLELTSAYGCIPAGGLRCPPTTILRVEDLDGRVIYEHLPKPTPAVGPRVAFDLLTMLRGAMASGTGRPAAFGAPHGGKTGTTQNNRDAWFVGFTPRYVCGVWIGNNDGRRRMSGVYGGTVCGPAWRTIVRAAIERDGGPGMFPYPEWFGPADTWDREALGAGITITSRVERPARTLPEKEYSTTIEDDLARIDAQRAAAGLPPTERMRDRPPGWYEGRPNSIIGKEEPEPEPPPEPAAPPGEAAVPDEPEATPP